MRPEQSPSEPQETAPGQPPQKDVDQQAQHWVPRYRRVRNEGTEAELTRFLSEIPTALSESVWQSLIAEEIDYCHNHDIDVGPAQLKQLFPVDDAVVDRVCREQPWQTKPVQRETTGAEGVVPHDDINEATVAHGGSSTLGIRQPKAPAIGQMGDYVLLEELGRGGMGVVYRAEQISAGRQVALKVVRPDKLSLLSASERQGLLDRFRSEAQAAAQLEHDHLVTVYEVGEADGKCFYSMRYVEGQSLYDLLCNGPLEKLQAARYLEPVARAVHETHMRHVLHRDLKPHNIMIERRGDRALVADFGLAKLLESDSSATETGAMLGSPSYMSPEQTRDASNVTAATDIYGLGATLYHMLTGRPPFQASTLAATIREVNEREPLRPQLLNPAIDAELEAICLKCLEKEPLRRYSTALELAEDLHRYREGKPIRAKRISNMGRAQRWARRNRFLAALSGATVVLTIALLVGGVAAYFNLTRAYYATEQALADAKEGRSRANQAAATARREAARATSNLRIAHQALIRSLETINLAKQLEQEGLQPLRRALLEPTVPFLEQLTKQEPSDPSLWQDQGQALFQLSVVYGKLGESTKAIEAADRSTTVYAQLLKQSPGSVEYARRCTSARVLHADHLQSSNEFPEAASEYQQALRLYDELVQQHPDDYVFGYDRAATMGNLATLYNRMQRPSQAIDAFRRSIEQRKVLRATHPEETPNLVNLAIGYENLANSLSQMTRTAEAEEAYAESNRYLQEAIEQGGETPALQRQLGTQQFNLGLLYMNSGRPDKAEPLAANAAEVFEKLTAAQPAVPNYPILRAASLQLLAHTLHDQGKLTDAIVPAEESVRQIRAVFARLKAIPVVAQLVKSLDSLASMQVASGDLQNGIASYQESLQLNREMLFPNASDLNSRQIYAVTSRNLALAHELVGQDSRAIAAYRQSLEVLNTLVVEHPDAVSLERDRANTLINLVLLLIRINDLQEAESLHDVLQQAVQQLPAGEPTTRSLKVRMQLLAVNLLQEQSKLDEAAALIENVVLDAARLEKSGTFASKAWRLELDCFVTRAEILSTLKKNVEAKVAWLEASATAQRLQRAPETEPAPRLEAAVAMAKAAAFLAENDNDSAQAELTASRAVEAFVSVLENAGPGLTSDFKSALRDPAVQRLRKRADFQEVEQTDSFQNLMR